MTPILDISDVTIHFNKVKLSSKGRYAVRALFDIAFYNEGGPTQVKDIAERQAIPPRFLEQIFQDLKRAGIVGSKRGPQGGYFLARKAEEVPLGEVIEIMEGVVSLGQATVEKKTPKVRGVEAQASGATDGERVTDAVFADLSVKISNVLSEVTVADVCERARTMGVGQSQNESYMYFI